MKHNIIFFLAFLSFSVASIEIKDSPLESSLYAYCNPNKVCSFQLSLVNTTNFKVDMVFYSSYESLLNIKTINVWDFEHYRELEIQGKLEQPALLKPNVKISQNTQELLKVSFQPREEKFFNFSGLEKYYKLDPEKDYFVDVYFGVTHFYIDNAYVGLGLVDVKPSSLSFPFPELDPLSISMNKQSR